MSESQPFSQECIGCGRTFGDIGAFTKHGKRGTRGKKRLANALGRAKELYQSKKHCLPVDEVGQESTDLEQTREVVQEPYGNGQQVLWLRATPQKIGGQELNHFYHRPNWRMSRRQ